MEGSGSGFPYYYHHRLIHLGHPGDPGAGFADGGDSGGMFPSPSSSSAAGDPALFPQSAVPAAAGGRASALAPAPPAEPARRKRGRPRKYGLAARSSSTPTPPPPPSSSSSAAAAGFSSPSGFSVDKASLPLASSPPPRAAPSRKKAKHESVGKGGQSFTPHFLMVAAGEDVVQRIMSFVQQQQRQAVCIISASGTISSATLRQPAMSGGQVTYEGHFVVVSLSGSFLLTETGGPNSRTGALSVCLSGEHNIVGGGVSGPLMAAGPVLVFAGSFFVGSEKNLTAPASMEKDTGSKLSTPFPEPDASPSVINWSTADSTGRTSTNSVADGHHGNTGGSGNSFMLQPRGVHVMPTHSSTDFGVGQESGHLGAAYRSQEGDDEHIHD